MEVDQVQCTDEERKEIDSRLEWCESMGMSIEGVKHTCTFLLHAAIHEGNFGKVKYLLCKGADVNMRQTCSESKSFDPPLPTDDGDTIVSIHFNYGHFTSLELAKKMGHTKIIEYLESLGAKSGSETL